MNQHKPEYTQGICQDGAAILKDGRPMTIEEILSELNAARAGGDDLTIEDYKEALEDKRRLTRELDALINGANAAEQASLCDIVAQVKRQGLVCTGGEVGPVLEVTGRDDAPGYVIAAEINGHAVTIGQQYFAHPAPAAKAPEGWKLVPIEPTEHQQECAAFNLCNDYGPDYVMEHRQFALDSYRHLVAVAPKLEDAK